MAVSATRIGAMRHRIFFQKLTSAPNGQGGFTEAWANHKEVWASVKPVKTKERNFSEQIQYQRTHEVIIRFRNDITQDMRFKFDGRTFEIKGVRRKDERKYYLIIDAEENQGT